MSQANPGRTTADQQLSGYLWLLASVGAGGDDDRDTDPADELDDDAEFDEWRSASRPDTQSLDRAFRPGVVNGDAFLGK